VRLPVPFLTDDRVFPPLGLLAVGAGLRQQGFEVIVFDGEMSDLPMDYPIYGFGPTLPEYPAAVTQLGRIRAVNPDSVVCIGGPFASMDPQRCLADGFDKVVVGDGEFEAGRILRNRDQSVVVAEECSLDDYPIPDRALLDIRRYKYMLEGLEATALVTSKGCPFRCGFCCKTYSTVRLRNAENVKREVDYLRQCWGYRAFVFMDDLFIMQPRRFESIAAHLKARGAIWRCMVRADLIWKWGEDFVRLMADSGCRAVGMGIESGSDFILRNINKGEDVATMHRAVRLFKDAGIGVKGFFILGLPGETHETMEETRAFLREADLDDFDMKVFQPYPGSPIWEKSGDYDVDWNRVSLEDMYYKGRVGDVHGNVRTSALATAEIINKQLELEREFKR
jgi:anaerobic magnesium-protoporphyrin IX monomethyl ester cyclase